MHTPRENGASFDHLARIYRWLEYCSFGLMLERCRGLRLESMVAARQALILGDGDGRFTTALLSRHNDVRVVAVDSSARMLGLLSARVARIGASSRLRVVQAEAVAFLSVSPEESHYAPVGQPIQGFDHVCSHFFLDCLSTVEVEQLVAGVCLRLTPQAVWIVSEFATPSWWARLIVAFLYQVFAWLTGLQTQRLPAWRDALTCHGFTCIADTSLLGGLLSSTIWRRAG